MSAHRASGVLLQTREEPLVKMVRGHIHEWRKQTAVKGGRGAASLHPLYNRDVSGKHNAPRGVQIFAPRSVNLVNGSGIRMQKLESLPSLIYDF